MKIRAKIPKVPVRPKATLPLKPGDVADDGSVYLGLYDDCHWFVTADVVRDKNGERLQMKFKDAAAYAKTLRIHGCDDWKIPEHPVMRMMFAHSEDGAFKDTFPLGSYWVDWGSETNTKADPSFARYVRSVPVKPSK